MDPLPALSSRLPDGMVSLHPGELSRRSRDWWALTMLQERTGNRVPPPAAVVFPRSTEDVATVLTWAEETETPVVARGGGSGVCGGAQAVRRGVVLDLSEMNQLLSVDEDSLVAWVQVGIRGDRLEQALGERGLTLGHYPQSLAISSAGGWIAAHSAGQASAGYGVIEDLLLGITVVLPGGRVVRLPATPRSAAGPDLRQLFVGSEGTFGVITEAAFSLARVPAGYRWAAFRPRDFPDGVDLVRGAMQHDLHPLVVRLYDDADAAFSFGELGHEAGPALVVGFASDGVATDAQVTWLKEETARRGIGELPEEYGSHWWARRLDAVELYRRIMGEERLFGNGVIVDTMEVAGLWSVLPKLYRSVQEALARSAEAVGCHLSHPYRSGASLYFTFLHRSGSDEAAEEAYVDTWRDAAAACHDAGGTMTHHHGVGILKTSFMERELGEGGLELLRTIKKALDPRGVMNPGKLLPLDE